MDFYGRSNYRIQSLYLHRLRRYERQRKVQEMEWFGGTLRLLAVIITGPPNKPVLFCLLVSVVCRRL